MKSSKRVAFNLEFSIKSSVQVLFNIVSTSAGLQEWYADYVEMKGNNCKFEWKGMKPEEFTIVVFEENARIRFEKNKDKKHEYLEFLIYKTEISEETILKITDFADEKDLSDQKSLWNHQVKELIHRLGG
ncbi:MAG: START-like domain-containing protein [Alphaproteobacteria bacterium]|nr:START-like domain-containing protein [Alphaproteobacteria bacterium]